jgi:hypothetical protein
VHANVDVDRNMIGAVVGSQPFGGGGLSGTGPNDLRRFMLEQVVAVNTAVDGGNTKLLADDDVQPAGAGTRLPDFLPDTDRYTAACRVRLMPFLPQGLVFVNRFGGRIGYGGRHE